MPLKNDEGEQIVIAAEVENLPVMQDFVNLYLEKLDCDPGKRLQIEIAAEEFFVNIANYAYGGEKGSVTVKTGVSYDPAFIEITFIDSGIPFDPLARKDPDTAAPAEERGIGGLGIYMAKNAMDEVRYEYKDGQNVLTMKKIM